MVIFQLKMIMIESIAQMQWLFYSSSVYQTVEYSYQIFHLNVLISEGEFWYVLDGKFYAARTAQERQLISTSLSIDIWMIIGMLSASNVC